MGDKNAANGAGKLKFFEKAAILGWYKVGVSAAYMKNKLKQKDVSLVPKQMHEVKMLWVSEISQEYLKNLRDSMQGCLKKVIAAKGNMTKY